MKTNIDKYESEKVWVKGVFWGMFISHLTIYYILPYFNYEVCDHFIKFCDNYYYVNFYFFSFIFIPLSIVFFMKRNYVIYRYIIMITIFLSYVNLLREPVYDDYFAIGPRPTALYIYIISTIVSLVYLYKQRKLK